MRRRALRGAKVFHVAAAYAATAFVVLQGADRWWPGPRRRHSHSQETSVPRSSRRGGVWGLLAAVDLIDVSRIVRRAYEPFRHLSGRWTDPSLDSATVACDCWRSQMRPAFSN
jgi:hypothetical protein